MAVVISSVLGMSLLAVVPAFAQEGPQGSQGGGNQGPRGPMMRIWGHRDGGENRFQAQGQGRPEIKGQGGEQNDGNDNEDNNDDAGNNPILNGTLRPLQQFMGQGMERGRGEMMGRSVGGKVTAVSSPNFTLELPRIGDKATTTVNVVTNASTTFLLDKNSASVSDVAVGDYALVAGPYASSTETITALRVNLSTSTPNRGRGPMMGGEGRGFGAGASTTPEQAQNDVTNELVNQYQGSAPADVVRSIIGSVFARFAHFFGR